MYELAKRLKSKGHNIYIITKRFDKDLARSEEKDGIRIYRIDVPKIKFFGLFIVYLQLLRFLPLFFRADVVHIHDVGIWYWPFFWVRRFFITFHGWEEIFPIPARYKLIRKINSALALGSISVSRSAQKFYGIKSDFTIYGAVDCRAFASGDKKKIKNSMAFLGRLDKKTNLQIFLHWLEKEENREGKKIFFLGTGPAQKECARYGKTLGWVDPARYLMRFEVVVPSGFLSFLEAVAAGCEIKLFAQNRFMYDCWFAEDFSKLLDDREKLRQWVCRQTWDNLLKVYLELWKKRLA